MTAERMRPPTGRAADPEPRSAACRSPLVGMLLFIASEVMFFGGLFAAYFNARAAPRPRWASAGGHRARDLPLAAVLTSSWSPRASRCSSGCGPSGAATSAALQLWMGVTLVLGVLFLLGQLYDY